VYETSRYVANGGIRFSVGTRTRVKQRSEEEYIRSGCNKNERLYHLRSPPCLRKGQTISRDKGEVVLGTRQSRPERSFMLKVDMPRISYHKERIVTRWKTMKGNRLRESGLVGAEEQVNSAGEGQHCLRSTSTRCRGEN